ncbi:hypothetical protein HaLaN_33065, partial [Haematococcus lacustris]
YPLLFLIASRLRSKPSSSSRPSSGGRTASWPWPKGLLASVA